MNIPCHLMYTAEHDWLDIDEEAGTARVGITAYAAEALGDVVYVELPPVGAALTAGTECGTIESTKSVSDFNAPASGVVLELNQRLESEPGLLNADPFESGWLITMTIAHPEGLLDDEMYRDWTGGP